MSGCRARAITTYGDRGQYVHGFAVLAQLGRMRMNIAKPSGITRYGVHHNGRLGRRPCLEHACIVVSASSFKQFDGKVHLGINGKRSNALEKTHDGILNRFWQVVNPSKKGQFHDGITNLTIVQFFHQVGIQIAKHATTIGHEEFSARFGRLEANKGGSTRSAGANKFIVHACGGVAKKETRVLVHVLFGQTQVVEVSSSLVMMKKIHQIF